MASTAQERLMAMDQVNANLLNRIIRLKLADGIKFKTVSDYLIEDYHDNIEFDAAKLEPLLVERANQTEKNYNEGLNNLIGNKFSDSKYSEQLPKRINENGIVETWSFVDILRDKPIGAIDLENGTLKHGPNTITVEDFYDVFINKNVLNVKLAVQNMVDDVIFELSEKNNYDESAIYGNESLRNLLFESNVDEILASGSPLTVETITSKVSEILKNNIQIKEDNTEVEKMKQTIETPVGKMEEMYVVGSMAGTKTTDTLSTSEINSLANEYGLTYAEQKKVENSNITGLRMSGPEDPEDVDLDGTTETEVELNNNQQKIRM